MYMQQAASKLSLFLTQWCLEETVQVLLSLRGAKSCLAVHSDVEGKISSFLPVNSVRLAKLISTHSPPVRNNTSKWNSGPAACSAFHC